MKKLVLGSLIAIVASQLAGCIITTGDDEEDAYVSATWDIRNLGTNSSISCPPTFDTAALYNQPVTSAGAPIGSPIIDLFNCSDRAGTSAPLPPQQYLTWIEITNSNNTSVFAKSLSAYVDVTVSDKTFNAQILEDGGYFKFEWALVGANSNAPLSCAQAGAAGGVEAVGTDVSTPSNSASDIFDCEDFSGITAGYRTANYTISVAALNAADQSIGTAPALTNKPIGRQNAVTELGTVTIPIDGQ